MLGLPFGLLYPSSTATNDMVTPHFVTTLPAKEVTDTLLEDIPTQVVTGINIKIHDIVSVDKQFLSLVRSPTTPMSVPVVAAKPTKRANVYTASIVAGMPDIHIKVEVSTKTPALPTKSVGFDEVRDEVGVVPFASGENTHDAIVHFPSGSNIEPIYISVIKLLTPEEIKKQEDELKKRQEKWDAEHPVELTAIDVINKRTELDKVNLSIIQTNGRINNLSEEIATDLEIYLSLHPEEDPLDPSIGGRIKNRYQGKVNSLARAKVDLNSFLEKHGEVERNRNRAEESLLDIQEKNKGITRYLSKYAMHSIPLSSSISMNRLQFAIADGLSLKIPEAIENKLINFFPDFLSKVSRMNTATGPIASVILQYISRAGSIDNKLILKDYDTMFAIPARLLSDIIPIGNLSDISSRTGSVNLPVRAAFVKEKDKLVLKLFKTGIPGVSTEVKVLSSSLDSSTGLYRIDINGVPFRTVLENPTNPPKPDINNTGSPLPDYQIPVHTGIEVRPVNELTITITPVAEPVEFHDYIIWTPTADGTGVEPIYVVFSDPYGGTKRGTYSGRSYNPDKAGGEIQNLDWKNVKIDRTGVDKVKLHTGRFGESADNQVMIARLEEILKGTISATDTDKRFYTHEIRELERYRTLGIKDKTVPDGDIQKAQVWNNTHTATLEDYKLRDDTSLLYTPEAMKAYEEQVWRENK
nr:colicin-like bacteriocin tRNase domain-containing protein [Pectobacterium colocasium]